MRAARMIKKYKKTITPPYSKKEFLVILGTAFLLLVAIPLTVISTQKSQDISTEPTASASNNEIVENQTLELLSLNSKYQKADAGKKEIILNQMEKISKDRVKRLSIIIEKNPELVLKVDLSANVRAGLPKEVQSNIEKKVNLDGTLEFLHIDNLDNTVEIKYFLKTKNKKFSLHSKDPLFNFKPNTNVRVSGVAIGEKVAVEKVTKKKTKVLAASDTTGNQTNAVILLNFQNNTTQRFTKNFVAGVIFDNADSVNAFYQEGSYGKASLTGDVYGWYTLPINSTCSLGTLINEVIQDADADINFQDYASVVFVYPGSCGYAGTAFVGKISIPTDDGLVITRVMGIIDQYFVLGTISHEMGHGFGSRHANAYECGIVAMGSSCASVAYGDPYDVMGSITSEGHFNAYHKELFAWLDASEILLVNTDGLYQLETFSNPSSSPKIIKVPRDRDEQGNPITWHYLEYRNQAGFDNSLPGNVYDGALVHYAPPFIGGDSHLLDITPLTSSRTDGALTLGRSFTDTDAGVTIGTTSKTAGSLGIQVNFGEVPCTRVNPTVVVSPSQIFARPGTSVDYTLTVLNNDSTQCGSSNFNLSPTIPTGWSSGFSSSSLSLNPGSNAQATFTVTSAASAPDGFYTVTASATNQSDTNFSGTDSAIYAVSDDLLEPSVSITAPTQNEILSGTVSVEATANDDVGVTKVEFLVDLVLVSTDTTDPYSFSWDTTTASDGNHTLSAKAYDASGKFGASSNVFVTVSNNDTQNPSVSVNNPGRGGPIEVSGVHTIEATASDNVGVINVEFYVDGVLIGSDTTSPYSFSWDTTTVSNGDRVLTAKAYDAAGNVGTSSSVTVTVNNTSSENPADINNDGFVNIFDLSILLSNFGTSNSTADINNDGIVNVFDLSILLSNWG